MDTESTALEQVAALARVLPLSPHLSLHAHEIACRQRLGEFSAIGSRKTTALLDLPESTLGILLVTIVRLLEFDNHAFESMVSPAQIQLLLNHDKTYIRYLAVKILCLYLHAADAAFNEMYRRFIGSHTPSGPWEGKSINYRFLHLWETKRLKDMKDQLESQDSTVVFEESVKTRKTRSKDPCQSTTCLAGVLIPKTGNTPVTPSAVIMTPTTTKNMRSIAEGLRTSRALLVTGLAGSGKTTLIREVTRSLGHQSELLTLHLNEQTDAKLLIGLYTSATTPGSFQWQPGVLTTAVREGRWVFVEDLDRAPPEVVSMLLPLLDRGELLVPNLGGLVRATHGFKLIATVRSFHNTRMEEVTPGMNMLGSRHWRRVPMEALPDQDLSQIFRTKYPRLYAYEPRIMSMYNALRTEVSYQVSQPGQAQTLPRPTGALELLRYCARLDNLFQDSGIHTGKEPLPDFITDNLFLEAIDCFSAATPLVSVKLQIAAIIARELHISAKRKEYCLHSRVPALAENEKRIKIGRASLLKSQGGTSSRLLSTRSRRQPFAKTNHALRNMEALGVAIRMKEPCLLVGETGTGKTTIIQELAGSLGHPLVVVNLSQQSEAGDLLGGYKPINIRTLAIPIKEDFDDLFTDTFPPNKNDLYLKSIERSIRKNDWARALKLWQEALDKFRTMKKSKSVIGTKNGSNSENPQKRRRLTSQKLEILGDRWEKLGSQIKFLRSHVQSGTKGFAFSFIEGNIIKAVRNGSWVLLDEINLASPDTLESISDLVSNEAGNAPSILLAETGDVRRVYAHPDFRIFGAMNPATDVGKRDLPMSLRSRFTEYFIQSPDQDLTSLIQMIEAYMGTYCHDDARVANDIAQLYSSIRDLENENRLVDGSDQKPHFSLRTLTRTLVYVRDIAPIYGLRRSLFEGFSMSFLTLLNGPSVSIVLPLIDKHLLGRQRNVRALLNQIPRCPGDTSIYVRFEHYWLARGTSAIEEQPHYIITPFVRANLLNLVRATSTRRYPVLLQGPTSSGKTSMIEYLTKISGNKFVRINNHEHTDLQEYLGTYVSGSEGLKFQDGILVRALREGHWIVLDELNLAPTDILEALNRLLDDNRELLIPETQEKVTPHPNFMLFATQNPPGLYGGRKILSRAFRNRFLELHFDDIPENELETILKERSQIAPSYCANIVTVYKRLVVLRQSGRLFEQKASFATLRDLFRWALRDADSREKLAINGFMLLAERVRKAEERLAVKEVIEDVMRVRLVEGDLYGNDRLKPPISPQGRSSFHDIVWTTSMRRLYVLIMNALKNNEPVLLVGATGCGKTTVCEAIAASLGRQIHILNAHQNTETGDIIGAQRPLRNRSSTERQLHEDLLSLLDVSGRIDTDEGDSSLESLIDLYQALTPELKEQYPSELLGRIEQQVIKTRTLFEWCDGSLVSAMKTGDHFLLDEISLADDSVLERLNSVLESSRTLLLAEKGSSDSSVAAADGFQFLATMNPGGDYGKKELSPALRNRFTEIWVPSPSAEEDMFEIVSEKLLPLLGHLARPMVQFSLWFTLRYNDTESPLLSVREVLAWVNFVNSSHLPDYHGSILHGAAMVYIDGLGANPAAKSVAIASMSEERLVCLGYLSKLFNHDMVTIYKTRPSYSIEESCINIGPFRLTRRSENKNEVDFSFKAPTSLDNVLRIVRALQLPKPILLEGNPGVGKTTLVQALASLVGVRLERINLSEQTDIMDLFGSDVPIEGGGIGQFGWRDAPFLQAMKRGDWVLLDEMNLASQSVLEGLNACLDHRGSAYIPELDQTFMRHSNFTIFAAQNPHKQGGGRKGLPASFVNRFTVVHADILTTEDLHIICNQRYPGIATGVILQIIDYVSRVNSLTSSNVQTISGGPWEFNLRDVFRWLDLLSPKNSLLSGATIADFQDILVLNRFRSLEDSKTVRRQIKFSTDDGAAYHTATRVISDLSIQSGFGFLKRDPTTSLKSIPGDRLDGRILESAMIAVQRSWPCLLVGASGSGKSRLIHYLATATGADVVTVTLNTDMDTIDLVGGYEQTDYQRHVSTFLQHLVKKLESSLVLDLSKSTDCSLLLDCYEHCVKTSNPDIAQLHELLDLHARNTESVDYMNLALQCKTLVDKAFEAGSTNFEWVDGILIKALRAGQWLVLDNANLCSSSVLDRLNSLLEPNGVLAINEHRASDGSAEIVKPHQDFRIFLTMDPRNGELSRAMRNRCIELYLVAGGETQDADNGIVTHNTLSGHLHHFMLFDWNSLDEPKFSALLTTCVENMSFDDLGDFKAWHEQALQGLVVSRMSRSRIWQSVLESHSRIWFQDCKLKENLLQFYESLIASCDLDRATSRAVLMAQSIHPLSNPPLLAVNKKIFSPSRALWLSVAFETSVYLSRLGLDMSAIQASLNHNGTTTMTRLERSMLSSSVLDFSRDSTKPLHGFLSSMLETLVNWVDENSSCDNHLSNLDISLSNQSSSLEIKAEAVKEMSNLLGDILQASHVEQFDGGRFQAHLMIGRFLAARAQRTQGLYKLGLALSSHLNLFDVAWKLSTGGSMEILWNYFRPPTCPTITHLDALIKFENLAATFDRIAWISTAPLGTLLRRWQSLTSVSQEISQIPVDTRHVIQNLENALRDEEARIGGPVTSELPYFVAEFESLRQYSKLSQEDIPQDRGRMLDLLAGRATDLYVSPIRSQASNSLICGVPSSTGIDSVCAQLASVRQVLPVTLLRKMNDMGDVPLNRLDRLREEILFLCQEVSLSTRNMSRDQCQLLNCQLYHLHVDVYKAHDMLIDSDSLLSLSDHVQALDNGKVSNEFPPSIVVKEKPSHLADLIQFQHVNSNYFVPSLRQAYQSQERPNQLGGMACAWINFFLGCLLLYVPDQPFDPALKPMVQLEIWLKRKTELENKLWALEAFDAAVPGNDTSFRCRIVKKELLLLGTEPKISPVVRPDSPELHLLHAEFSSILATIAQLGPVCEEIISAVGKDGMTWFTKAQRLRQNINQSIARLTKHHRRYDDVTKPMIAFLKGLEVGLALSLIKKQPMIESECLQPESISLPFFGIGTKKLTTLTQVIDLNNEASQLDYRLLLLKRISLERTVCGDMSQSALTIVMEGFHSMYREWKGRLAQDQDVHAAKTSLYRYQGSETESHSSNDVEFQELFPAYDEATNEEHPKEQTSDSSPRELAQTAAELHDAFVEEGKPYKALQAFVQEFSLRLASTFPDSNQTYFPLAPESMLSGVILNLDMQKDSLSEASKVAKTYNFYMDANLGEGKILIDLLRRILDRFQDLQEAWPEHVTLENVLKTTYELLAFRHTEPLAKILTKAEKLHTFIYEWDTVASSQYTVLHLYNELTNLLVNWRRLELSTWGHLLDLEDEKCLQDARSWWFVAYEALFASIWQHREVQLQTRTYLETLTAEIQKFLITTSLGQYTSRLRLISNFSRFAKLLGREIPAMAAVHTTLESIQRFYCRYEPDVSSCLEAGREALGVKMKEILLLASWKDTNIAALRESAKRSHKKLFRVVRKYRDLLAQPAETLIQKGLQGTALGLMGTYPSTTIWNVSSPDKRALDLCEQSVFDWTPRPRRYKDTKATASLIAQLVQFPYSEWECALCINDFLQNIVATIGALQKETPPVLNAENKDKVKHLKSRKRKVFADTLRELRTMGIRSNLDRDTLEEQTELHRILANTPVDQRIANSEPHFYGALENIAIIRETSRQHSEDLSGSDVARSLGFLEGILTVLLRQRRALVASYAELDACDKLLDKTENLWCPTTHDVCLASDEERESFESCLYRVEWVIPILDVSRTIVEKHERMSGLDFSVLKSGLATWEEIIENTRESLKSLPGMNYGLITTAHRDAYAKVDDLLSRLGVQLDEWKAEFPEVAFVLHQIQPWLGSSSDHRPPYHTSRDAVPDLPWGANTPNNIGIDEINEWMLRKVDSEMVTRFDLALGRVQTINKILNGLPKSSEDASWLQTTDTLLIKALGLFQLQKFVNEIEGSLFGGILRLDLSGVNLIMALSSTLLPILQQYRNSYLSIVTRYYSIHTSLCALAYVLSNSFKQIVVKGFCSPQEKSANQDQAGKLEDGVGLGDGEGAEDLSKDVQDDEDLSELAQEQNAEKNGDMKDENDAIDMKEDNLDGELGEDEDMEQEDGDNDQSKDDDDDIDEEVGSVDELDPSAIDEKLWDGEKKEEQREKRGDKSNGKEQDEIAAQEKQGQEAEKDDSADSQEEPNAQEREEVVQGEEEVLDRRAEEDQNLDLPEEMKLDGNKEVEVASDDDMDGEVSEISEKGPGNTDDNSELNEEEESNTSPKREEAVQPEIEESDKEGSEVDLNDTGDAGSPVDTEPEDIEIDDDGLLKDHDHNTNQTNEDTHEDDARGTGIDDQQQAELERVQDGGTQGANGMQQDSSQADNDQAMADVGDLGHVPGQASAEPAHNAGSEDSSTRQSFQKLGEALEKWHRQSNKIREAQDNDKVQSSIDMDDDVAEFEHLLNDDVEADTQALGATTEDQASALDKRALEAEMRDHHQDFPPDTEDDHDPSDVEMKDVEDEGDRKEDEGPPSRVGAMIGPNTSQNQTSSVQETGNEAEVLEEIDNTLLTVSIEENDPRTRPLDDARRLWSHCESVTRELSLSLTEQLRLILAPTLATKMRGDFRTGKRLNIKRIIPYIASQYKRDKIWMRRSTPSKRSYQIMLAVDDSKSMSESANIRLAFETLALLSKSLSMLEVGQICIVGFGDDVHIAHPFDQQFSGEAGVNVFQQFTFQQRRTDIRKLVSTSLEVFREARAKQFGTGEDLWQLQLIISDGICEDHESIRRLVRQAHEERIMIVFAVVDALNGNSIVDMTQAIFEPDGIGETKLRMKRYLDGFPFAYYLIVGDVKDLPNVLSTALRQFFAETVESS